MAHQAQGICASPGCPLLTYGRFCEKHNVDRRKQYDRDRKDDPVQAIYNMALWQRVRKYILGRDPLCMIADLCVERQGHAAPSTVVDHIKSVRSGGDPFDSANLQGSCKPCHDRKTATEDSTFAGKHE
jgi:5-methylcytosine-specific restriction protein A